MPRRLSRPFYPRLSRSLDAAAEQEVSRRRRNQSVGCTACRRWVDAKEAGRADNPTLTSETAADADPAVSSWMYDVSPPPWTSTFPGPNPRLTLTLTGDIQFQEIILAWNISWKFNWNFHLTWKFHGISVKRRDVSIVNLSRYHCFCYVIWVLCHLHVYAIEDILSENFQNRIFIFSKISCNFIIFHWKSYLTFLILTSVIQH